MYVNANEYENDYVYYSEPNWPMTTNSLMVMVVKEMEYRKVASYYDIEDPLEVQLSPDRNHQELDVQHQD